MLLKEAKEILKKNGYVLNEVSISPKDFLSKLKTLCKQYGYSIHGSDALGVEIGDGSPGMSRWDRNHISVRQVDGDEDDPW